MKRRDCNTDDGTCERSSAWLFFADTPIQILNAIVLRRTLGERVSNVDIAVLDDFRNADDIINHLKLLNAFDNVFTINTPPFASVAERRFRTFAIYGSRRYLTGIEFLEEKAYSGFAFSCPSLVTGELYKLLRQENGIVEVMLYEDGMGSYSGDVFRCISYLDDLPHGVAPNTKKVAVQKSFARLLAGKAAYYRPSDFFVYRPDLLRKFYDCDVHALLPAYTCEKELQVVFPEKSATNPDGRSVVVLDSIRRDQERDIAAEEILDLVTMLVESDIPVYIRSHPRTTHPISIPGTIDITDGMWEMQCSHHWIADAVIISSSSSGMLSPCMLYSHEPHLVFLYNTSDSATIAEREAYSTTSRMACTLYKNVERVHVPKGLQEAKSIVRRIVEG